MIWALCAASGRRKLKWFRREIRGKILARNLKKASSHFNPKGGFHIVANADRINGLARAYRYEIARLATRGGNLLSCSAEAASNFLILGQPKDYPKLLAQPPVGFRDGYRIGLLVTEFETPPQGWDFAFDILHEIWTPSAFSAKAIRQATRLPVKVVPHAVSVPDAQPMPRERFGVDKGHFLGMAIMDLSSCPERKNPLAHVNAWKLAFGGDPAAHLMVKVKFSQKTLYARRALVKAIGGARNITLIEDVFSDSDMCAFQRMADVYLSLHRAEGYGLNIHEMLEIGTPVLATGWSGNMDFMPRYPNAVSLPFKLVPYNDPTFHFQGQDLLWAEADIETAARALHDVRDEWNSARTAVARRKAVRLVHSQDRVRAAG
jgi:glycosyltransferase involved in cell wall biosynthesis